MLLEMARLLILSLSPSARGGQGHEALGDDPDRSHHHPRFGSAENVWHLVRVVDPDEPKNNFWAGKKR